MRTRVPRFITASRCRLGCLWLHEHDDCPDCGGRLTPVRIPCEATLISDTVVRVNPSGSPIHLAVAKTSTGASTLCVVDGPVRGNGRDKVRLVFRDGKYHAVNRSRRRRANREGCRKS
jgi:uncharacterized OB-fold protein